MSISDTFENALLALLFNATPIANIADNTATSPATNLYLALHTANPGDSGTQATSETAYASYARKAVARTTGGFTAPSAGVTSLAANQDFTTGTTGAGDTCTYFSVGLSSSGAGIIIMSGPISPSIVTGNGIIPRLTTATTLALD